MNVLEQFGVLPVDYFTIVTAIGDYKSPNDKVAGMEKKGELIRLKKGLYVVSPEVNKIPISRELIANHLYGPSYVSMESALSFYGLIPERTSTVRSVTVKRGKFFSSKLGDFEYVKVDSDYYQNGIKMEVIDDRYAYLIATPEKALCDLIITTSGLRIQSLKQMKNYLEDDLRIDFSVLEKVDIEILKECAEKGKKKTELAQLLKYLEA